MAEFDCAPVLLIGFNRPERLKAQVDRLRAVKPRRLFVAVDGPRPDRPGEAEIVARTRAAVAADETADRRHANRSAGYVPRALTVWGNVARRSLAARALGGWIVPFAHWVERRFPALFRI